MAHEIDFSNGQANVAMLKKGAWHNLGQILEPGQPIDVWAKAAGLAHTVERASVQFVSGDSVHVHPTKDVLYRNDTNAALSVVSKDYKIVQPAEVLDFFAQLAEYNNFELESAGSLSDGKRIWAMAKVNDGEAVIGQDVVKPYIMLATSYDGTLATTARFTSVRVVCSNTLGFASNEAGESIRISHNMSFDAKAVATDLGLATSAFEAFMFNARKLAKHQINKSFAEDFLKKLLPTPTTIEVVNGIKTRVQSPIEKSKAYKSILALFHGEALGSDLPEAKGTAWQLLNAVTEHVDHTINTNGAWFGYGNSMKNEARDMLLEIVA